MQRNLIYPLPKFAKCLHFVLFDLLYLYFCELCESTLEILSLYLQTLQYEFPEGKDIFLYNRSMIIKKKLTTDIILLSTLRPHSKLGHFPNNSFYSYIFSFSPDLTQDHPFSYVSVEFFHLGKVPQSFFVFLDLVIIIIFKMGSYFVECFDLGLSEVSFWLDLSGLLDSKAGTLCWSLCIDCIRSILVVWTLVIWLR